MHITKHLAQANKTIFSYEIVPPLRGSASIQNIFDIIDKLLPFNPKWINVTTHASSLIYIENPDGTISKRVHKKRPGTIGICGVIQNKYNIDAVAHMICQGFSQQETEDALIELNYMGIDNILALKGDNLNYNRHIADYDSINNNAVNLVQQVNNMKKGKFLGDTEYPAINLCTGVAGYPEKHFEAANMELNLHYLKQKIDAGAEYIVTQMFYDNQKFFNFVKSCRDAGITVPIIPGVKVIKSVAQLTSLPKLFHIDIPSKLTNDILDHPEDAQEIGINWTINQVKELIEFGVPCIHFFLMNDVNNVIQVIKNIET